MVEDSNKPALDAKPSPKAGRPYERSSDQGLPEMVPHTPQMSRRDPSIPAVPTTSKAVPRISESHMEKENVPCCTRFGKFCYDKNRGTFCDRTCKEWAMITGYSIMYLIFLSTYTMILLYLALLIVKQTKPASTVSFMDYQTYSPNAIGLTGVPLSEHNYPLIWYRSGEPSDYQKYVKSLDRLLEKNQPSRQSLTDLGPCGTNPYGYGEKPCLLVKINKQWKWHAKPLSLDSPNVLKAPVEVRNWMKKDTKKYWLHCKGFHDYDTEHIGQIRYYPHPPGFDSSMFPLNQTNSSPLVAVQFQNFTLGMSLAVECKLWYHNGDADIAFMLYVTPKGMRTTNTTMHAHF